MNFKKINVDYVNNDMNLMLFSFIYVILSFSYKEALIHVLLH